MAHRNIPRPGQPQRTRTMRAPRRRPALGTGHRRQIAPPRHLDQHGSPCLQCLPRRLPRQTRQPRGHRPRIPRQLRIIPGGSYRRRPPPHRLASRHDLLGPARLDQQLRFSRTGEAADKRSAPRQLSPGQQHLTRVRVGRPRLGMQVVPVVPDDHQPQPSHRREHRRPRPRHHRHPVPAGRQEPPVPLGRPGSSLQSHMPPRTERLPQGPVDPLQIPRVRNDDDHPTPTARRSSGGPGDPRRPILPGQRGPHRPRAPPLPQRLQEGGSRRIIPPPGIAIRRGTVCRRRPRPGPAGGAITPANRAGRRLTAVRQPWRRPGSGNDATGITNGTGC
ncbi:hypothetical protein L083_5918 [Actinoplanes sp. N902-109]|nr:hypothetical protein L083_5918 [Actinoplanes sp. N902-109]